MRSNFLSFSTLAIFLLSGCNTNPKRETLQRLVDLASATSQEEFCTASINEHGNAAPQTIEALLSDLDYDCGRIYLNANGDIEDSVLVLTKRRSLEVQTLYYDFAKRDRQLKTWDNPGAADKRVKLNDKIYLQTSGFD